MGARAVSFLVLAALLAVAASAPGPAAAASKRAPSLRAFSSCDTLLSYARRNARRAGRGGRGVPSRVQPLVAPSLPGPIPTGTRDSQGTAPQPAVAPQAGSDDSAGGGTGGPAFSETNVQEAGIDEPDVVKTDGRRIVAVAAGVLRVLDVTGPAPRVTGSLELEGFSQQLFVRGDRALVLARVESRGALGSVLTEVDLADPAGPTVRRTLALDGAVVDARLSRATARVVVASTPRSIALPDLPEAGVRTWVPRTVLRSRVSGRTFRRSVVPCDDVRRPRDFSGLDLLTVLTIDLDRGLYSVDRDAIMAGAETVYAAPGSLYVASRRFGGDGGAAPLRTEIHRFDTSRPDSTSYRSSGQVEGYVLNQYSLSEHRDALRVATTTASGAAPVADGASTESAVTVLAERGPRLERIGGVGGLGKGEQIFAVRFLGDEGYVVTFRQTDPLYALDLSDHTAPRVRGELKILGYSAYLHPVGEGRLLGVGQDATEGGARTGAQLSLFDVSDLSAPKRVDQASLGSGSQTEAEFDPHAFLFWSPSSLAVVPASSWAMDDAPPFIGAIGFRVGRSRLEEAGRVEHPKGQDGSVPPIGRSLVVGDRLYTVSVAGVAANRLDSLKAVSFTGY